MTVLALVTDNTQLEDEPDYVEQDIALAATHTADEKTIYRAYVKGLKRRGFCKLDDATSAHTRLFNRFDRKPQSMSFISSDFSKYLNKIKKACRMPTTAYITYTLEHIVGQRFIPNASDYWTDPITECTYANTWRQYKPLTSCTEVPELFILFLERLFPNETERHIAVQWLSHIFQRPEERPSWHLLLNSEVGTGKGFLVESILHPLLHHTQVIAKFSRLTGQFNTTLEENLLVLLDDCKATSSVQQTELKSLLSERRVFVERKQQQGGMVDTCTRIILASNEVKPLDLDEDERRWFVPTRLVHKEDLAKTQQFIKSLQIELDKPGSLDAIYYYFMNYDTKDFNPKFVAQTATLLDMVKLSKGIHGDLLAEFIEENEVFTTAEWMAEYDRQGLPKLRDVKTIPALLAEAGYEKSKPTVHGERNTLCYPKGWSPAQIEEVYPKKTDPACTKQPY